MLHGGVENDSNLRRREREREMLEQGEALWKAKQRQQWISKIQDQREARELLLNYAPWGRPGCGAPNNYNDVRKKKSVPDGGIMAAIMAAQHKQQQQQLEPLPLGRPGCGAPLRTRSGRLQAAWRADPILRFHEPGRRCVDNELRYRASPHQQLAYRTQLDQLVSDRLKAQNEARKSSTQDFKHMLMTPAPWGRPGPGGTSWRPHRSNEVKFLHSLGWSSEPTLHALASQQTTSDVGKAKEDASGNASQPEDLVGSSRSRHKQQSKQVKQKNTHVQPGAGFELVPLLAKRRAAAGNFSHIHHSLSRHPLCSTDITRHDVPGISEPRFHEDKDYQQTLKSQVLCRQKQLEEMRLSELQTTQKHFETWRQFWGRPGHGAPKLPAPKVTLADLLSNARDPPPFK